MEISQLTALLAEKQSTELSVSILKSAENLQQTVLDLIPGNTGKNVDTYA